MSLANGAPPSLQAVVSSLTQWGLSADADLVYRALVTTGPQLRGDLSRALGLAPRRVSAALEELRGAHAARTVARPSPGRREQAQLWAAAHPSAVTDGLQRRRHAPDPWERVRRHAALTAQVGLPAWPDGSSRQPRILFGRDRVRSRIAKLMAAECHEHLAMNPEPAFDAATVRIAAPLDQSVRARGVDVRTLGVPAPDGDATAEHERRMARLGLRHRIADTLPLKLIVFDHRTALLPVDPLDPGRGALEVDDPEVVHALIALFREQWDAARSPAIPAHLDMELSARETAVIELLAAGHTDPLAAARLHTSARTVRYTLRDLMDRLCVENRFQLGLALGALGVQPTGRPSTSRSSQETT